MAAGLAMMCCSEATRTSDSEKMVPIFQSVNYRQGDRRRFHDRSQLEQLLVEMMVAVVVRKFARRRVTLHIAIPLFKLPRDLFETSIKLAVTVANRETATRTNLPDKKTTFEKDQRNDDKLKEIVLY